MARLTRIVLLLALPVVGAFLVVDRNHVGSLVAVARTAPSSMIGTQPSLRQQTFRKGGPDETDVSGTSTNEATCWNPQLRRVVGSMAGLGVLETAYLAYTKWTGGSQAFCGPDGGCNSVLSGPYAVIPLTDIPLSALGLVAYSTVTILALIPLTLDDIDDTENRIWLTAATTTMGAFSVFLMSLLFGVLHTSCPYCIFSAFLSIGMAGIVWIGGGLPEAEQTRGLQASAGSLVTSVFAATLLYFGVEDQSTATQFVGTPGGNSQSLFTSSEGLKPPPVTAASSERTLALASELRALDARMYGAYWCSHCYEQKQTLGKEAFAQIQYVECSKEGFNQQTGLCRQAKVPGYPTWSLGGKLYPGEQSLEELEEIVKELKK